MKDIQPVVFCFFADKKKNQAKTQIWLIMLLIEKHDKFIDSPADVWDFATVKTLCSHIDKTMSTKNIYKYKWTRLVNKAWTLLKS